MRRRGERGAAAVEFALISIPLMVLLLGIIQFAIFFWAFQMGSHAAREGARVGAVTPCAAAIEARAVERLPSNMGGTADATVPASLAVGGQVSVRVTLDTLDIGIIPGFPAQIVKSATSRIENVPAGGC